MIEQAKTNGVQLAHDGPDVIDPRVEFSENRAHVANPHATSSSSSTPVFPSTWGPAPTAESRDYRALPGGYGHGSSTLATWISLHMAEVSAATRDLRVAPTPTVIPTVHPVSSEPTQRFESRPDTHGHPNSASRLIGTDAAATRAQACGCRIPRARMPRPSRDVCAQSLRCRFPSVPNPLVHLEPQDAKAGVVNYPPAWGAPPMVQTLDLRPLPLGYGQGSGTLLSWICEKAVAHGYAPEELSAAEGDLPVGTQANQRGGTRHQRHG
jgi:hypothetical protein